MKARRVVFVANDRSVVFLGEPGQEESPASWPSDVARRLGLPPAGQPEQLQVAYRRRRLGSLLVLWVGPPDHPQTTRRARRAAALSSRAAARSQLRLRPELPVRLNADQRAVFELLARGLNNTQIAARLGRQRRWVCYRVAELKQLLGADRRSRLAEKRAFIL